MLNSKHGSNKNQWRVLHNVINLNISFYCLILVLFIVFFKKFEFELKTVLMTVLTDFTVNITIILMTEIMNAQTSKSYNLSTLFRVGQSNHKLGIVLFSISMHWSSIKINA